MIDWERNQTLLLDDSDRLFRELFAENRERGDRLVAVGYTFEFGSGSLNFDLCANTERNASEAFAQLQASHPEASAEETRWNSGDFDYPGGIGDFSHEWWNELTRLDQLAATGDDTKHIYDGIVEICCAVLARLAIDGVFGDWTRIDFNVAALLDELDVVQQRDEYVRQLINQHN